MPQSTMKQVTPAPGAPHDLDEIRQTWIDIGLSTEPANRKAAEEALRKVYAAAGLDAPGKVVWCGSPFSQGLARAIVLDQEFPNAVLKSLWKNALAPSGTAFKSEIADSFRSSMRLFDTATVKQNLYATIKSDVSTAMRERLSLGMKGNARTLATDAVWDSVWTSVWDSVDDTLWHAIDRGMRDCLSGGDKDSLEQGLQMQMRAHAGECVKSRVWEEVMDRAWANLRNGIDSRKRVRAWEGLWRNLQASLWENVATPIGEQLKACGNDSACASGYGQHDAYWLAFYAYFREVEGLVAETDPVTSLIELAKCAGWFVPHKHICWICERPSELHFDSAGRLHADEGPAIVYPDGWQLPVAAPTISSPVVPLKPAST